MACKNNHSKRRFFTFHFKENKSFVSWNCCYDCFQSFFTLSFFDRTFSCFMKTFGHFSLLIPLLLFITHQIIQQYYTFQFLDSYLDPFCLGAIMPYLIKIERGWLFNHPKLSLIEYLVLFVILAFTSEVLLPYLSNSFYQDVYDLLSIFLGMLWNYLFTKNEH